jgi:hypothetical protein
MIVLVAATSVFILLQLPKNPGLVVNSDGAISGFFNRIRADHYGQKFWLNQLDEVNKKLHNRESTKSMFESVTDSQKIQRNRIHEQLETPEEKEKYRLENRIEDIENRSIIKLLEKIDQEEVLDLQKIKRQIESEIK